MPADDPHVPGPHPVLFDGSLDVVKTVVDDADALLAPASLIQFVVDQFTPLFEMGVDPKLHPLVRGISDRLKDISPAVPLTEHDGVIERTGVRHLVLRANTFVLLLQAIPPDRVKQVATRIGKTAAVDLVEHALRRHLLIPKSAWALVELWNYWDRTGGWGRYSLVETALDAENWRIKVENNFLPMRGERQAALSDSFWCGYIHGFLNEAMPDLMELMLRVDPEQRQELLLPVGKRVNAVSRDYSVRNDEQAYVVDFHDEPLSEALKCLAHSYAELFGTPPSTEHSAQNAIIWSARALLEAERGDPDRYSSYIGGLDTGSKSKIERVRQYLTRALPADLGSARECYKVCAEAVHELVRISPETTGEQPNF